MSFVRQLPFLFMIILFISYSPSVKAQVELDQLEPEEYFDFWVGTWELTWKAPDGTEETGTNTIEKILDDNVILENFEAHSGQFAGYKGKSFSVYQKITGTWRQTWVDNSSEYIDLNGTFKGNKRIFITEGPGPDGNTVLKRMVFYNITENSFTWDWESSSDDGKTWKLLWRIHYKRKI